MVRLLSAILVILIILTYQVTFMDKFYPGIFLGDTNLVFLDKAQAEKLTNAKFADRSTQTLALTYQNQNFYIDLSTASASIKTDAAIDEAFKIGRSGNLLQRLQDQVLAILQKKNLNPKVSFNINAQSDAIAASIYKAKIDAKLSINGDIEPEVVGSELDKEKLNTGIRNFLTAGQAPNALPVKILIPEVTTTKASIARNYLKVVEKEPIKLIHEDTSWTIDSKTLLSLLDLKDPTNLVDRDKLSEYLKDVSNKVNQPLKEAQFNFDATSSRVSAFVPAQEGRELDIEKTATLVNLALKGERPKLVTLPVKTIEPKIKTSEVNNLGIKELLGQGVSYFAGSIPNRIYNVGLTASKINGVLVPPGEIFSFNRTVGDISAATGFKQAYVIKEGRTVLDDGGGVCQDSTTLFRAALNAGLPIVKRTAHAYRVGYYEQGFPPGLDATIYYPSVDFQFKNDTGHHILIQAHTVGTTLTIDLYGTSDGRVANLTRPIITSQTPAPPELRQDDPTLPKGVVKQVDFAAAGANVVFQRTVVRNGETIINETYRSNYRPWQAVYLVGTGG
jgi:vancomycin resistance protein YoaR